VGTGLGLAIARESLERNGGSAGIRNGEHGGACATLRLPDHEPAGVGDFTST
jgi:signal transduction histidine kinase